MSERKVLNKYYPPDFDPSKIPRLRQGKSRQIKVRLVAPFAMRCSTCGQWIGKGTKFNARKETVDSESYLGIPVHRFYIRCQRCAAEITFKTDPENNNYVAENGAQRNFEPWRETQEINARLEQEKADEADDPMRALEARTEQSRRELEGLDALDELRAGNARGERVAEELRRAGRREGAAEDAQRCREDEADGALAKQVFAAGAQKIKRVREEDVVERERLIKRAVGGQPQTAGKPAVPTALSRALRGVKAVKKPEPQTALTGMLAAYGSDDDDDDSD